MKNPRILLIPLLVLLASVLSACAGSSTATSWPGLTVDDSNGTAYLAYNQQVYAIKLADGTESWRFPEKPDNKMTFYAPPALTQNSQLIVGSYDNILYSLNPQDNGKETQGEDWPFTGADNRYIAKPLAEGDHIFAPNANEFLYALDSTGKKIWEFKTHQALWAMPAADGNTIYLPSMDHHVYAIDAKSGQSIWSTEDLGGAVVGTPAIGPDGTLYVGTFASEMLALDSKTGKVIWRKPVSGWVYAGPALDGDTLYFGDLNGNFYALSTDGQTMRWPPKAPAATSNNGISDKPLVYQGTVYYTSEDGNIYALDAATGNPRWSKTIGGKLYASPVLASDKILVSAVGADNLLYALDMNGNEVWKYNPESK